MKLLIVDDSKAMRMILTRILRQAGYSGHTFFEAANGVEALQVVAQEQPDLILSDWNMPEMSGIEFLQKLREGGNRALFGFVTTESTPEARLQAELAGAHFVIRKPFTPEAIAMAIDAILV